MALDFLTSEVTSFLALLYSSHNLGLLDDMACLVTYTFDSPKFDCVKGFF